MVDLPKFIFLLTANLSLIVNLPKADFAERMKVKPEGVTVLHILGPGFLANGNNYIFHMLASFIAEKIKLFFNDSFKFSYVQSEPVLTNNGSVHRIVYSSLSIKSF